MMNRGAMRMVNVSAKLAAAKHRDADGSMGYTVYRGDQKVATVARGWLRLGGIQWVANMPNCAPIGEKNLRDMWKRIGRILQQEMV